MLIGPISQLPVFVMGTVVFKQLAMEPTPFDSESFLTLTTLNHPDPTWTLPICLGVITMANVELSHWATTVSKVGDSSPLQKRIKEALRGLSVLRILIAAWNPGVRF